MLDTAATGVEIAELSGSTAAVHTCRAETGHCQRRAGEYLAESLLLQTWLSPAFPTGAYSYSHGLEAAIAQQRVDTADTLQAWLRDLLHYGSLHNDAILFTAAWHAAAASDTRRLTEINTLSLALMSGAERLRESLDQGAAFCVAVEPWRRPSGEGLCMDKNALTLPIAAGATMAAFALPLCVALGGWIQSFLSNLVWIAVRLVPLGQQQGLSLIASLQCAIECRARELAAARADILLDLLGSSSVIADIASMQHEHLPTRLCLS